MKSLPIKLFAAVVACFFGAMQSHASNLPDELLNAPIHLMSGEQTSLAANKGKKPVYLKFWATWCQPCLKQMPHFEHVQKTYGDKIEVIGINLGLNEDVGAVKAVIKKFGLTMPMAIDKSGDLAQGFHLLGTPYHLLFDKNMNLIHQGHEADESLDRKLEMVSSGSAENVVIDPAVLVENEPDIQIDTGDGKVHALLFTATWGDWYLKDSRPVVSQNCIAAQKGVNRLSKQFPDIAWMGVVQRLWTGDKDVLEYIGKYGIEHPVKIDKSNRLFHQYGVNNIPTLVFIRNGQELARVADFDDVAEVAALIRGQRW